MPSSTTPHMPGTMRCSVPSTMWQVEVPMIITMRPGSVTVAAGTETWASTLATATAMPGRSPVRRAISAARPPARAPNGTIVSLIFSRTMSRMRGCRASKKSGLGNPACLDQIAL